MPLIKPNQLIPTISMHSSMPTFFLISITQWFVNDITNGRVPDYETVVLTYEPIPENCGLEFILGLALLAN